MQPACAELHTRNTFARRLLKISGPSGGDFFDEDETSDVSEQPRDMGADEKAKAMGLDEKEKAKAMGQDEKFHEGESTMAPDGEPLPEGAAAPLASEGGAAGPGPESGPPPPEAPLAPKKPTKTLDVVFMVHLQRGSDVNFTVEFDNRWCYAFIDSMMPASNRGLLDVEDMMGVTLADMLDSESVDLAKVLGANFRYAMARLVYLFERSNDDVRGQISLVLDFLQEKPFIDNVQQQMLQMIEEYGLALDLSRITDVSSGLTLIGTFQQALHQQFTDTLSALFSVILSHMDRNGALELFGDTSLRSLWLYLFRKSFADMGIIQLRRFTIKTMDFTLEVKADGFGKAPFKSQFPFSFFLSDALTSMQEVATTIAAKGDDASDATSKALQRQFELLAFEHGISGELPLDLLKRYMHDFACIHLMNSKELSKTVQADLLWSVLSLHASEPIATLAQIHGRYWDCEKRVTLYCHLMDAVPPSTAPLLALLSSTSVDGFCSRTGIPDASTAIDAVVLQIVLDHLEPTSESQQWRSHEHYGRWSTQMDSAKPQVISLLSGIAKATGSDHASVKYATRHWEKLTLIDQFVRDIAVPLLVEPSISLGLAQKLQSTELRTSAAIRALIPLLCEGLVTHAAKREMDVVGSIDTLRRGATGLMEFYFFELCFSETDTVADTDLLADCIGVLAGRDLGTMDGVSKHYDNILSSEVGRVALLTEIVQIKDSVIQSAVLAQLNVELAASVKSSGFLDTPFCATYLSVLEEALRREDRPIAALASSASVLTTSSLCDILPQTALSQIAAVRQLLFLYAQQVSCCVEVADGVVVSQADTARLTELAALVEPFLGKTAVNVGYCRSMRMYFLKVLERLRGVSYVRSAMQQDPILDSAWLKEWVEENEVGLVRFMGANKLPPHNPFKQEALFDEASRSVAGYLASGDFGLIMTFLDAHREHVRVKGALALGLFHEIGLLAVLPNGKSGDAGARIDALADWIPATPALSWFEPMERKVLSFCCGSLPGDRAGGAASATGPHPTANFLRLDTSASPEKVVTLRMLAHLAAKAMSAVEGEQLYFFRTALFMPAALKGTKYPTMPEDALAMVQRALMDAGVHSGAKRWYTCPNGHPFAIGDCGGAVMATKCPECGEEIGGTGHKLKDTNKPLGKITGDGSVNAIYEASIVEDKSESDYCLRTPDKEEKFFTARKLSARAVRVVRTMLHGCFTLGHYLGGEDWVDVFKTLVHADYASAEGAEDPGAFVLSHLRYDLAELRSMLDLNDEQLVLLLHEGLLAADRQATGGAGAAPPSPAQPRRAPDADEMRLRQELDGLRQQIARHEQALAEDGDDDRVREALGLLQTELRMREFDASRGAPPAGGAPGGEYPTAIGQSVMLRPEHETLLASRKSGRMLQEGEVGTVIETMMHRGKPICQVRAGTEEEPEGRYWHDVKALVVCGGGSKSLLPASLAQGRDRDMWEAIFAKRVLDDLLKADGLGDRLREIEAGFSQQGDEGAAFKEELLERFEVSSLAPAARLAKMPGLWVYRRPFSFVHFDAAFKRSPELDEQYPVLASFLEARADRLALQHMPAFFRWLELVINWFDRSIDRQTASTMTIADALAKIPKEQRRAWDDAYSSFETVWNLIWPKIEAFGCTPVPATYREIVMNPEVKMAFTLPGAKDEGMCPAHIAEFLKDQHNECVQRVDQAMLMRNQDLQRHSTRENEVLSTFMTPAHVLRFDTTTEFVPYVMKQCVRHTAAGETACDFASAEKFLMDRYFRNKPLVNLRLRGFKYADDVSGGRTLASKVPQVPLAYDVARRITEELQSVPENAHRALEMLETCTNFLTSASFALNAAVGEKKLEAYMRDDLLMHEEELQPFGTVIRQQVSLNSIDDLVELLQKLTDLDPLEQVDTIYREQIDATTRELLTAAAPGLNMGILLPIFKRSLITRCAVGAAIAAQTALCDSIGYEDVPGSDDCLVDLPWFTDHFPRAIEMRHAVAAYNFLAETHK